MKKILGAGILALLGGCSLFGGGSPITSASLDELLMPVAEQHRDERACLALAGAMELGATRALYGEGGEITAVYGRLVVLNDAIADLKAVDPNYLNADLVDVAFQAMIAIGGAGRDRIAAYAAAGPSLGTALALARNTAVQATKADALVLDIVAMLTRLEDGTLTEAETWTICEARAEAQLERVKT